MNRSEALRTAVARTLEAVDATFQNVLHMARLADLSDADIPRICISAGCQALERLIGAYAKGITGETPMTDKQRERLKKQIADAAADLTAAFDEGQEMVRRLMAAHDETKDRQLPRPH